MKNKILLTTSLLFTIVLAILVLPVMSAATVLVSPVVFGNYSDEVFFNITTSLVDATNVTCWYNTTGTDIDTANELFIITNSSSDQLNFTTTLTISGLDALNYTILCQANSTKGATENENATAVSSITFDSTDPVCSIMGDHVTIPWKGNILLSWASSDGIDLVSTSVTIDGPQDYSTTTYTDTSRDITLTSQDTKYWGDWLVTITGTDRPENTCTETYAFKSYLPDGVDWLEPGEPKAPVDTGRTILILLIVGVVGYFVFFNKKK